MSQKPDLRGDLRDFRVDGTDPMISFRWGAHIKRQPGDGSNQFFMHSTRSFAYVVA